MPVASEGETERGKDDNDEAGIRVVELQPDLTMIQVGSKT